MDRLAADPDLHVYHYAPYEPSALKRLMGRYGTREDEVDQLLRAGVLVDLLRVVRQSYGRFVDPVGAEGTIAYPSRDTGRHTRDERKYVRPGQRQQEFAPSAAR